MDSDLEILIRDRATVISPADVKSYMRMVLSALVACRRAWVLHRDIKPSNFLVCMSGARHTVGGSSLYDQSPKTQVVSTTSALHAALGHCACHLLHKDHQVAFVQRRQAGVLPI